MADSNDLSGREREILHLVAKGASNKEIARDLHISANTVKVHLRNIFNKVGANSRTEAAMYAVSSGLVALGSSGATAGESDIGLTRGVLSGSQSVGDGSESSRRWNHWIILGVLAGIIVVVSVVGVVLRTAGSSPNVPVSNPIIQEIPRWQEKASLNTPRKGLALAARQNSLYAIAGQTSSGVSGVVERYDLIEDRWETITPKPVPVTDINAVVVGGLIYVPGGQLATGNVTNVLEIYDPVLDLWKQGANLPTAISSYALTAYEGKIYLIGGWDGKNAVDTVYIYDPDQERWSQGTSMPTSRSYPGVGVSDGKIYVIGGFDGQNLLSANEIYSPDAEESEIDPWVIGQLLPQARYAMGVTNLAGTLHVFGGVGEAGDPLPSLEYSTQLGFWEIHQSPFDGQWSQLGLVPVGTNLYLVGGDINGFPTSINLTYQAIYTINIPIVR